MIQSTEAIAKVARELGGKGTLRLLLLFGSRARGDAHPLSDWDLGFLAGPDFDVATLQGRLVEALGTERIDLVDLASAGALLRFRAARDGMPLYEQPGAFEAFWLESVHFWCEAGPVLRDAYGDLLQELRS